MMKLKIKEVGPINDCSLDINDFNVIIGKQSSGKSTIAKSLYLFLLIKDGLARLAFECHRAGVLGDGQRDILNKKFKEYVRITVKDIFGSSNSVIREGSLLRMEYKEDLYIQVSNKNVLTVSYGNELRGFIDSLEKKDVSSLENSFNESLQKEINDFFGIDYSPIYIPAGRSLITVMGNQFEYFYATLDDDNKRLIDLCTRNYLITVMRLKPLFGEGLSHLWKNTTRNNIIYKAQPLVEKVINGEYYYSKGEEYLRLKNGQSIRINMASSGQQEALWIYNILLYNSVSSVKKFYIIEEPESNLFPESQQYISKFLGLIANCGNLMLINTHSPYVLGELNNMLYAGEIKNKKKKVSEIINKECQLTFDYTNAFFIGDGTVYDCMDYEIKQIDNSKLDAISGVINEEYDKLIAIERGLL